MTRSDRERRDAEKAARRARRLADRAEQRAQRKDEQAQVASERAELLADRANRRRRPRDREMDASIEDFVDDITEKWSQKATDWLDIQSKKMRDEDWLSGGLDGSLDSSPDSSPDSSGSAARRARRTAETARQNAERAEAEVYSDREERYSSRPYRRSSLRKKLRRRHQMRRRRGLGLYRDTKNKKICGVCAGTAEYFGFETWQVRGFAILGLFFLPSIMVPAYFITYFLMDKKPYYREAAERYEESHHTESMGSPMRKRKSQNRQNRMKASNVQALKTAKQKFSAIEDRLREMESHVTSSQFELKREFRKISGEE